MLWPHRTAPHRTAPHRTAPHRKERIADGAFQGATCEAAVGFHVADFGFDGAAASEVSDQLGCQAPAGAADQHAGFVGGMAAITTIDHGKVRALVGQDLHLL